MPCRVTYTQLAAYAAGLLETQEESRLREHLKTCETCRPRFDSLEAVDGVLAVMPPMLPPRQELEMALAGVAFATLPQRQREVLAMHVFNGMSYREIAQVLNVPEDKAVSLVQRARVNLARALEPVVVRPMLRLQASEGGTVPA